MSRKLTFLLLLVLIIAAQSVFAQNRGSESAIRNNRFFLESQRFAQLARDTFEYSDYDSSVFFSEQAIYFAHLSDEYIALQLKIRAADEAIAAAKQRLDWAVSSGAAGQYPKEYGDGQINYAASLTAYSAEDWDEATRSANKVIQLLANLGSSPPVQVTAQQQQSGTLPAQYTVRPWATSRDCFWNIAGYPWVYGDSYKWKQLYEANKSKIPDPNNPNLLKPGTVLDIPSIKGETRQGMWNPNNTYSGM